MNAAEELVEIEKRIENALWESVETEDQEKALKVYTTAKNELLALEISGPKLSKERDRVMAYCLMRIDDALVRLGDEEFAVERAQEALQMAERSEDVVQIARCKMMLGARLMGIGKISEGDKYYGEVIKKHYDSDDIDLKQAVGWTLLARGHLLIAKSLYNQAKLVFENAIGILRDIENWAGLRSAYSGLSKVCSILGMSEESERASAMSKSYGERAKKEKQ